MIPDHVQAEILRLRHVERWKIGTIANHLDVHHQAVRRVLYSGGGPSAAGARPSWIPTATSSKRPSSATPDCAPRGSTTCRLASEYASEAGWILR